MKVVVTILCSLVAALFASVPGAALGALAGIAFGATAYGAMIGAAGCALIVGGRTMYWYVQGFRLQNIGYIPPAPSTFERIVYYWLCRAALRIILGPVKFIGQENAHFDGRLTILTNHQHGFDFLALRAALPFAYRQVGAAKEVLGWRAGLAAFSGTFAVPVMGGKTTDHEKAELVIEHCARLHLQLPRRSYLARVICAFLQKHCAKLHNAICALLQKHHCAKLHPQWGHRRVALFPQGRLVYDNVLRPEDFRTGAMREMQKVDTLSNHEPLAALVLAVHYWDACDCDKPNIGRRFMVWLWNRCFPDYGSGPKYGATVVLGRPIEYSSLPGMSDTPPVPRIGIEHVRVVMQGLLDQAKAQTPKRASAS